VWSTVLLGTPLPSNPPGALRRIPVVAGSPRRSATAARLLLLSGPRRAPAGHSPCDAGRLPLHPSTTSQAAAALRRALTRFSMPQPCARQPQRVHSVDRWDFNLAKKRMKPHLFGGKKLSGASLPRQKIIHPRPRALPVPATDQGSVHRTGGGRGATSRLRAGQIWRRRQLRMRPCRASWRPVQTVREEPAGSC
jgi:hypothetical protein